MSKAYSAAVAYRDSIIAIGQMLAGEEVTDDPAAFPTWQDNAKRLARELRSYAEYLDLCAEGGVSGPIVFPSWKDD